MAAANIFYSYISSIGTECLQKFSMNVALFSIVYTLFMMLVENEVKLK
ncbi:hypothetical protein KY366_08060 [Candidatus Woesearchaeota archaeon]|nr:hypothetical protein [Candidatus Woesearchaeota archaeon]